MLTQDVQELITQLWVQGLLFLEEGACVCKERSRIGKELYYVIYCSNILEKINLGLAVCPTRTSVYLKGLHCTSVPHRYRLGPERLGNSFSPSSLPLLFSALVLALFYSVLTGILALVSGGVLTTANTVTPWLATTATRYGPICSWVGQGRLDRSCKTSTASPPSHRAWAPSLGIPVVTPVGPDSET